MSEEVVSSEAGIASFKRELDGEQGGRWFSA